MARNAYTHYNQKEIAFHADDDDDALDDDEVGLQIPNCNWPRPFAVSTQHQHIQHTWSTKDFLLMGISMSLKLDKVHR